MVELLAPSGNFISLRAVLENGADSTYIGLNDFNMRANANNFSIFDLKKVTSIAREYSSKVYLCSNVIMKEEDVKTFLKLLPEIASSDINGIILADIGLIEDVVSHGMEAHISVQENVSNSLTLKSLKKLGAKRAILSRELSLNEIKEIASKSPIETEIFIHGAMCMAISGRCFLSYGLYNRSANCGDCLQPCRKMWTLKFEENSEDLVKNTSNITNEEFIISESFDDSYRTNFFSPQDMAMIEHIPELIDSKVDAFKIEGRSRAPDYSATATKMYRKAIDSYLKNPENYSYNPKWMDELSSVFNRGFDTGFYFFKPYKTSENNQSKFVKKDIGKVVNYYSKINVAEIKIWDDLVIGDEIMIQGETTGSINQKINSIEIDKKQVEKASKGQNIAILMDNKVRENDFVYKLIKRNEI
ncbi:peptidase U32 family protein [Methanobrevibacter sp. DSM 116169]|uniref:peptidase U32 family protein n=1 Tax=Methanobrevibacter sp. DSM 116169 TaxID=3242727 RepID=UPI0038FD2E7C